MTESGKRRRVFPDAFKLEVVGAGQGGRSMSQVAAELGLPDRLVRSWLGRAAGRGTAERSWAARRPSQAATRPPRRPLPRAPGGFSDSITTLPNPVVQSVRVATPRVRHERTQPSPLGMQR
ncbi:transposase [Paracraurococcus lichenis]|uniref:transposase n=1 Tax=Paracraurococcus lichenis TaxID=3064888 RepID=UPI00351CF686